MVRHVIAPVDELPPGTRKFLTIDERPIAIFNIKGEFFGLLNRCPHQGAALCEGPLIGLAMSSDPGSADVHALLAMIHDRNGKPDKAAREFDRALQIVGWRRTLHLSNEPGRVYEMIGFRQLFLVKPAPTD